MNKDDLGLLPYQNLFDVTYNSNIKTTYVKTETKEADKSLTYLLGVEFNTMTTSHCHINKGGSKL